MSSLFRNTFLLPSHYAGKWAIPSEDQRYNLAEVNELAREYALLEDSPEKESKLLQLLEKFHGYLMKYLCMIIKGTIPPAGSHAGRDAIQFLYTLKPKGVKFDKELINSTCKTLHFAFKGVTTEEIYDTLVFCLVQAARQFDPHYASKTKQVCEVIPELQKQFTVEELESRVGFSCDRILPALGRKGMVASVIGKKKVVGYKLGPNWPPPAKFFEIDPIGFVYVAQLWFRYYLKEHHIIPRLGEVGLCEDHASALEVVLKTARVVVLERPWLRPVASPIMHLTVRVSWSSSFIDRDGQDYARFNPR